MADYEERDPFEDTRMFGDAIRFEEEQVARDRDAGEGREEGVDYLDEIDEKAAVLLRDDPAQVWTLLDTAVDGWFENAPGGEDTDLAYSAIQQLVTAAKAALAPVWLVSVALDHEAGGEVESGQIPEALEATLGPGRAFEWNYTGELLVEFTEAEWQELQAAGMFSRVSGGFVLSAEMP